MRIWIIFPLLLLLFSVDAYAKLNVFACEPEWAALVEEIGGDKVNIYTATTALQDPHHIEARPSLIAKMRRADLMVCTGAGLEIGWLPLVIRQSANSKVLAGRPGHFLAAMHVERLDIPKVVDRAMGDVHPQGNSHVHLDPYRIVTIAAALTQRMAEIDLNNAQYYQERLNEFLTAWKTAIYQWEKQAESLKGVAVATYHNDWRYLFEWLGMQSVATLEPKPGIAPSAGSLAILKDKLQHKPARMVIFASYQNAKAAQWLSDEMKIPLVELPYTVGGNDQANDLFALFDDTLQRILKAVDSKQ